MNDVLVDTSGFLALLVSTDTAHRRAKRAFAGLAAEEARLFSTSYVLVETYALLGRRLGRPAVEQFRAEFAPLLDVLWIGADGHERGLDLLLESGSATLSLVDAVSFITMRDRGIEHAFAFDRHFTDAGFTLVA